jgi:DNA primase
MTALARLLDRVPAARKTGSNRYMARCPAHEDRTRSLSVRELDDGRVLVHCFAGCEIGSVLSAIGLQLADLYPEGAVGNRVSSRATVPAADVLAALAHEAYVASILAAKIAAGEAMSSEDLERLELASRRIGAAHAR